MYYSKIDPMSIVDGEGCRVTLFVSGCRNHCKGCFNTETWNFEYGQPFTDIEQNELLEACDHMYINGLTILGGEPFEKENQPQVLEIINAFRKKFSYSKTIWLYSGYHIDDLLNGGKQYMSNVTYKILSEADMLVEGPFVLEQRDLTLQFRGSKNQRLMDHDEIIHCMKEDCL